MNYPQIMSPAPFASKSWGYVPRFLWERRPCGRKPIWCTYGNHFEYSEVTTPHHHTLPTSVLLIRCVCLC